MPERSVSRVLVADDEDQILSLFRNILGPEGLDVIGVHSGSQAIEALRSGHFDVVYTDLRMPDGDGIEVLRWCGENCPDIPVMMITGHATVDSAIEAMKLGAFEYIQKPFNTTELQFLTRTAVETAHLRRQNRAFRRQLAGEFDFSAMIGQSRAMRSLQDAAKSAAGSNFPALIVGESGSGKTTLASAIHYNSDRGKEPLMIVDCAAFNEAQVREFFGSGRDGMSHVAASTSILFEDVGQLPEAAQLPLIQWIERTREVRTSNARILATANTNLRADVDSGDFREDLYWGLSAIQIEVPPLRARPNDIPQMADALLERIARSAGTPKSALESDAVELLRSYRWPGNIRELTSILEHAHTRANEFRISAETLALPGIRLPWHRTEAVYLPPGELTLKEIIADMVEQVERAKVIEALELTAGNRRKAAGLLGISLRALMYKLRDFNLS